MGIPAQRPTITPFPGDEDRVLDIASKRPGPVARPMPMPRPVYPARVIAVRVRDDGALLVDLLLDLGQRGIEWTAMEMPIHRARVGCTPHDQDQLQTAALVWVVEALNVPREQAAFPFIAELGFGGVELWRLRDGGNLADDLIGQGLTVGA